LAKQLGINSNLAYLPSARANIRARTRLAIAICPCMRDSWPRFLHTCMTPDRRLMDQEHLEALVGLLFSFCQVQNTKHLERGSFFTPCWVKSSGQMTIHTIIRKISSKTKLRVKLHSFHDPSIHVRGGIYRALAFVFYMKLLFYP
jgi:hypothetical protein